MLNIYKTDLVSYKVSSDYTTNTYNTYLEAEAYALGLNKTAWINITVSNVTGDSGFTSTVAIQRKGLLEDIHPCYKVIKFL
jgi:hypothetical protein